MNSKESPIIQIKGYCGTGKTTLAILIQKALSQANIKSKVTDSDHESDYHHIIEEHLDECLKAIAEKKPIKIEVIQLNRAYQI